MLTQILPLTNLLLIITISAIAIHNFSYLHKHRNDKGRLKNEIAYLYPHVEPEYYDLPIAQQIIENNQEIHEINKKLVKLTKELENLKGKNNG